MKIKKEDEILKDQVYMFFYKELSCLGSQAEKSKQLLSNFCLKTYHFHLLRLNSSQNTQFEAEICQKLSNFDTVFPNSAKKLPDGWTWISGCL